MFLLSSPFGGVLFISHFIPLMPFQGGREGDRAQAAEGETEPKRARRFSKGTQPRYQVGPFPLWDFARGVHLA